MLKTTCLQINSQQQRANGEAQPLSKGGAGDRWESLMCSWSSGADASLLLFPTIVPLISFLLHNPFPKWAN